ncbi:MAG: pilus assembly protein TadB [Gemmataceae bacterium]
MSPLLLSVLTIAGVTAFLAAGAFLVMDLRRPRAESRLDTITGRKRSATAEQADIWKQAVLESDKRRLLDKLVPKIPSLHRLFEQADVSIPASTLAVIGFVLAGIGITVSWLSGVPLILVPVPGLFMLSLPLLWLLYKRRQRLKTFAAQLPDALELVARALRAGHSLAAGMHVVAEEMPAPIAKEFGRVYEEQNLGIPLEEAMKTMCERVPNLDLRFFVTAVAIQRQTGGDLAEILDKIGYVIRERYRILGQVKALTGEGRLSGIVLIALPFVLFLAVMHLNYKYVEVLWTTEAGIKMTIGALIMQILGALVIRKIVNIKV